MLKPEAGLGLSQMATLTAAVFVLFVEYVCFKVFIDARVQLDGVLSGWCL